MKRRETLGQITGTDLRGNVVTLWVDRDDQATVLSHVSNGMLRRHVVENPTNLEAEAARVFEIIDVKFSRVH